MKQECVVSNEQEATGSYTEKLILKVFMEQFLKLPQPPPIIIVLL